MFILPNIYFTEFYSICHMSYVQCRRYMLKITLYEIQIQMWVHNLSLPASFEESVSINYVQLERGGLCGCSQLEKNSQ